MSLHDCGIADCVYCNVIGAALCSPSGVFLNCGVCPATGVCKALDVEKLRFWWCDFLAPASTILAKRGTARGTCGDYHMSRTDVIAF